MPYFAHDASGAQVPQPLQIVRKGWFSRRELGYSEAEAYHLREAAKLAGPAVFFIDPQNRQAEHLRQAELNRAWAREAEYSDAPRAMPLRPLRAPPHMIWR